MKAHILEMFASIQGEGKYAGAKQVFVRFFECNMHCVWCDTPHSIGDTTRRYKEYSVEELFAEIQTLWTGCHSVSLTGGEPLMQADVIQALLPHMHAANMPVHLETNGVFPDALKKVIDGIDVIAMDLKLPSSTQCKSYWDEHAEFLKVALAKEVFIKTVVSSDTSEADVIKAKELVASIDPNVLFILQPNTYDMKNGVVEKCLAFQKVCSTDLNDVRVLPQTHKFLKLR